MRYLLDTHVFLWTMIADSRIEPIREILVDPGSEVFVSAASFWEIEIKHAGGKLPISSEEAIKALSKQSFRELPVTARQIPFVTKLVQAPGMPPHRDPFDNLLVAQAKAEGLTFLTADRLIAGYQAPCVRYIL